MTGGQTLTVHSSGGEPLFSSSSKWLHPLFELEEWLTRAGVDPATLFLRDKIVGIAAAFLIKRLGVGRVHAELLSEGACSLFDAWGLVYTWDARVPAIACTTEKLLSGTRDPEAAYAIVNERRRLALAKIAGASTNE